MRQPDEVGPMTPDDRQAPQHDRRDRSVPEDDGTASGERGGPIENDVSDPADGRDRTPSQPVANGARDPRDPWLGGG